MVLQRNWISLNTSSPVCVFSWDLRTPEETNPRPHNWHLYGFSPVCERTCCFRWLDFLKPLLQYSHLLKWMFALNKMDMSDIQLYVSAKSCHCLSKTVADINIQNRSPWIYSTCNATEAHRTHIHLHEFGDHKLSKIEIIARKIQKRNKENIDNFGGPVSPTSLPSQICIASRTI